MLLLLRIILIRHIDVISDHRKIHLREHVVAEPVVLPVDLELLLPGDRSLHPLHQGVKIPLQLLKINPLVRDL